MSLLDTFSLSGKVAVITGGAGLYGRQLVRALAGVGAETFVASRNLEALKGLADTLAGESLKIHPVQFDQGEEASAFALRDLVMEQAGHIDVLVNNAVSRPLKKGYHDDIEAFAESMRINATGLFAVTRALGGGSIVNIGSIQGMIGPDPFIYRGTEMNGWYPDYFFHKGGMINFTRFVASYYGANGVRCNCLSPGGFRTASMPEAFVRQYSERTFLGRLANDTDLMGALVFLASDASIYITGVNLPVDGGYTAK